MKRLEDGSRLCVLPILAVDIAEKSSAPEATIGTLSVEDIW